MFAEVQSVTYYPSPLLQHRDVFANQKGPFPLSDIASYRQTSQSLKVTRSGLCSSYCISAAEVPITFQSDMNIITYNLAASRLCAIFPWSREYVSSIYHLYQFSAFPATCCMSVERGNGTLVITKNISSTLCYAFMDASNLIYNSLITYIQCAWNAITDDVTQCYVFVFASDVTRNTNYTIYPWR